MTSDSYTITIRMFTTTTTAAAAATTTMTAVVIVNNMLLLSDLLCDCCFFFSVSIRNIYSEHQSTRRAKNTQEKAAMYNSN